MGISIETAELIALALTTFLYGESRKRLHCLLVFPTSPRTGLFFALFLITTVVMCYKVTEDIHRQRTRILPVSLMMLLVATTVGSTSRSLLSVSTQCSSSILSQPGSEQYKASSLKNAVAHKPSMRTCRIQQMSLN